MKRRRCHDLVRTAILVLITAASVYAQAAKPHRAPVVSFNANETDVLVGARVVLSWASSGKRDCFAEGDWAGKQPNSGFFETQPLNVARNYRYELRCSDRGDTTAKTVVVSVRDDEKLMTLDFTASPQQVPYASSTVLRWNADGATACTASGDWEGERAGSGEYTVESVTRDMNFGLQCEGPGGLVDASQNVSVVQSEPPTVELAAAQTEIVGGESVTLRWQSTDAVSCDADGAWTGSKGTAGSETIADLQESSTFSLTCRNAVGTAVAMTQVEVLGTTTLAWQAPTHNDDGSPISGDLNYKIYYGESPSDYTDVHSVGAANATSTTLTLPAGTYYIAMTAVDAAGTESLKSREIARLITP